jgi:hypothetical protein
VTVDGKNTLVSGAILVWGRVADVGREAVIRENKFEDILSLEEIIADLLECGSKTYGELIADRAAWCQNLFHQLVRESEH